MRPHASLVLAVLLAAAAVGCENPPVTPSPAVPASPSASPLAIRPTASTKPTASPSVTLTPSPVVSASPTPTAIATPEPTPVSSTGWRRIEEHKLAGMAMLMLGVLQLRLGEEAMSPSAGCWRTRDRVTIASGFHPTAPRGRRCPPVLSEADRPWSPSRRPPERGRAHPRAWGGLLRWTTRPARMSRPDRPAPGPGRPPMAHRGRRTPSPSVPLPARDELVSDDELSRPSKSGRRAAAARCAPTAAGPAAVSDDGIAWGQPGCRRPPEERLAARRAP